MNEIEQNIRRITQSLLPGVRLVAVSKYNAEPRLMEAYQAGQRLFGESHAQELLPKAQHLPKDIQWHFIGHLQTNKVKQIMPYVSCIESVDSSRLLWEIEKQAAALGRKVACLLQFYIAQEESKSGFAWEECHTLLRTEGVQAWPHVCFTGVMGMATATDDEARVRGEFALLHRYFDQLKRDFFAEKTEFKEISMGMTHDYPWAMQEGATLVRVGSGIFGERMYYS